MTTIINLYGGPSTGKSTSAAYIYYLLKNANKNAELVREYAKNWAWQKRKIQTYDQLYFLGKQSQYESSLYDKVEYIVTDSPVLLGGVYATKYCPEIIANGINSATMAFYAQAEKDGHKHHHVLLQRTKPYNPAGRYQTVDEAKKIDGEIHNYLDAMNVKFTECGTDEKSLNQLINNILDENIPNEHQSCVYIPSPQIINEF